ncbi:hypothetical protein Plhal304r1_c028g0092821 [Plasmopara halstedii]
MRNSVFLSPRRTPEQNTPEESCYATGFVSHTSDVQSGGDLAALATSWLCTNLTSIHDYAEKGSSEKERHESRASRTRVYAPS